MDFMLFSKHIVGFSPTETARRLRAIGIEAMDLTVRPGGHIEPERVEEDLPAYADALAQEGVRVGMITTNILSAQEPLTEKILRCAVQCGIRYYKLGYYHYEGFGNLRRQRLEAKAMVSDLGAINQALGICGGFHNHSDTFIGASLWDVDFILNGTEPRWMGLYFDPAHAVIEGGSAGWIQGLDLLKDRVVMLAVKDFVWNDGDGYAGARRFRVQFSPLADGNVPWPHVLKLLNQVNFAGPVSFHSEYQGSHSYKDLTSAEVFEQTGRDLAVFQTWLNAAAQTPKQS